MNDDCNEAHIATGDEDTISLIDIMAVFLRHRRLILLSTLCAVALAVAAYFVYPLYQRAKAERDLIVEANMMMMCSASFDGILNQTDGSNFILQSLRDPSNILEAMQKAGYEDLDKVDIRFGADADRAIYAVRRQILENKALDGSTLKESSRRFVVTFDKGVISIIFKNHF